MENGGPAKHEFLNTQPLPLSRPTRGGIAYGVAAYGFWGLIPLYFRTVSQVAPLEILAHRALWSCAALAVLVLVLGRWGQLWRELKSGKLRWMLALSSLLIAANWLTFIYAVVSRQVLQSSLGYFINPLVSVLLGVVVLHERLRPYQTLSIVFALAGVLVLASLVGAVPWIALTLAVTFALYGLLRKVMPVDGLTGLTVETLVLLPLALGYVGYLSVAGTATASGPAIFGLLMLSGPVTTVPLLFFGAAARRLRLTTMGFLQYLTPSLQFLCAVLVFREPFSLAQILSFALIWIAIGIYMAGSLIKQRG